MPNIFINFLKITFVFLFCISINAQESNKITFTENKGQVSDQNYKPRPDVLFSGSVSGMVYHLRKNGISYQLNRVDSWREEENYETKQKRKIVDKRTIYRLDINWHGINKNFVIKTKNTLEDYNNYYSEVCPNGINNVKTYTEVYYKNIYNNIDLHYYQKNNSLKYDYIVAPNGNYKQIQIEVKGADKIELQKNGSIIFETPLGKIQEGKPLVFQNGKQLKAKWTIKNTVLSFDIEGYDPGLELIIDPAVRIFGTFYGGAGDELTSACAVDANDNVFLIGSSTTVGGTDIATVGSYQAVFGGGYDAFVVKFNSNGVRLWGTYYGGTGSESGISCTTDATGNVYLAGGTDNSGTVISSPGAHQVNFGGGSNDIFLVKFDGNGIRLWGTYYGGSGNESLREQSCKTDVSGNVYLAGITSSSGGTVIATPGCHQLVFGGTSDGFLVKFSSTGARQWATYYGGAGDDYGFATTTDAFGNVFLGGFTTSAPSTIIATSGSHQSFFGGGSTDGFLVKFNTNGVRQWGTYYGSSGTDYGEACSTDANGNIYLAGFTDSNTSTAIATATSHQPNFGGTLDAFLVKFNTNGIRQWGTYYGAGPVFGWECSTDVNNKVYLVGLTSSTAGTVITTSGSHQTLLGGGDDAFIVQFDGNGVRQWGSYYGGTLSEYGVSSCSDSNGNVYLTSTTPSTGTAIATSGSSQPNNGGGGSDAFLVKFLDCILPLAPTNSTSTNNQNICNGFSTTLTAVSGTSAINWYSTPVSTITLGTGSVYITPVLSTGSYTYYAESFSCLASGIRTPITITVNPNPTITVGSGTICAGGSFTLNPLGANNYTYSSGSPIISPAITSTYSIIGTSSLGCIGTNTAVATIMVNSLPAISVNNGTICSGSSFTIIPNGANTYTYEGGNAVVNPTTSTSYTVAGTSTLGCISNTVSANIFVNTSPTLTLSLSPISGSICPPPTASSAFLNATGANTYTWMPGSLVSSSPIVQPTTSTNYTVTGKDINGCTASVTQFLFVYPSPMLSVTPPSPVCSGSTACFATSGDIVVFNWNGPCGDVSNSPNPCLNTNTSCGNTYTVGGTNANGCVASTTVNVIVNGLPIINASTNNSIICIGQTANLTANGANTYTWNTTATTSVIAVSPTINTTYTVNGTDVNGCSNFAMITQSVSACTGIQDYSQIENIKIYPNPTNSFINIELQVINDNTKIEIYNSLGQLVLLEKLTHINEQLNIHHLSNGIYFLKIIEDSNIVFSSKIIKH